MITKTDEDVLQAIASGESDTIEFKRRLPPDHVVSRVLSAFANSRGGMLILGVDEDGSVLGLTDSEADVAFDRLDEIVESVLPEATWEMGRATAAGKQVIYVWVDAVPASEGPVATARGEAFVRDNTQDVLISPPTEATPSETSLKVFVAMSFREEEEPALVDYWEAMLRAASACGGSVELHRIDLREGDYEISNEIMQQIDEAHLVIADFTLNSRNVYFELGYARGNKKQVIQTARKDTVLEFDIRNWRTIIYRNATELEKQLKSALLHAYSACTKAK